MFACEEPDWSSSVILNFYATIKISIDRRLGPRVREDDSCFFYENYIDVTLPIFTQKLASERLLFY